MLRDFRLLSFSTVLFLTHLNSFYTKLFNEILLAFQLYENSKIDAKWPLRKMAATENNQK